MKKLLLPMLASVASIAIADAAPFNGFYAGAQLGMSKRTSSTTMTQGYAQTVGGTASNSSYINFTKKDKKTGIMYGLFAGWGKVVANGFYAGAEAVLYDTNTNTQQNISATESVDTSSWPFTAKYKRGPVFGLGPRVGFVIDGTWLAYGKLGLEFSKDQVTYQNITSGTVTGTGGGAGYVAGSVFNSSKKLKMAFVPEIGLEKAFGPALVRLAVSYNLGAKMNQAPAAYTQTATGASYKLTETQSSKYSAIGLKLGVAYQF